MNRSRLAKLVKRVSELPCPRCRTRRADREHGGDALGPLSAADAAELDRLMQGTWSQCGACGAVTFDLTRMSGADLDRVLAILRPVCSPALRKFL
ncbi:hypothetical protein J8F10_31855 [Gemmata sp. G18]|uniref:Transcription factor zinc-finger domain-containing protein n=1 Tax=Gemmata palustris TaxID=2822762 RepID=A0ABS5C1J8_9BACT|nr:hypothetical protein [Gemmata palustris]MBP3959867.1 hypothetical protein [Gemmata palustris]